MTLHSLIFLWCFVSIFLPKILLSAIGSFFTVGKITAVAFKKREQSDQWTNKMKTVQQTPK